MSLLSTIRFGAVVLFYFFAPMYCVGLVRNVFMEAQCLHFAEKPISKSILYSSSCMFTCELFQIPYCDVVMAFFYTDSSIFKISNILVVRHSLSDVLFLSGLVYRHL